MQFVQHSSVFQDERSFHSTEEGVFSKLIMAAVLNLDQNSYRVRVNRRGHKETVFRSHLKLNDLKEKAQGLYNQYIKKEDIPPYPQPEFHVTRLKHDTTQKGLRGIYKDDGFKNPFGSSVLWWSLDVGSDEIDSAEKRLLKSTFPDLTEEQAQTQRGFLKKFATSPAFEEPSRLGPYRFTFPLEEVLKAYSQQFCDGAQPMMRAFRTSLFKQLVMYTVLVHSPANEELFCDYPLLDEVQNPICTYRDGCIVWWPEAMCETHSHMLVEKPDEQLMEVEGVSTRHEFYVWDLVSLALHVGNQVLKFDASSLGNNLMYCSEAKPSISDHEFDDYKTAKKVARVLWPDSPALKRADEDGPRTQ